MDYLDLEKNASAFDNFWYKARRDLIKKLMIRHGVSNKNILEIGCGAGSQLEALSVFDNSVVGSDINAKALEVAANRGHKVFYQNIEEALAHDTKYDLICAFDVLEHVEHDQVAMTNIYSMLKPDGLFMYSVPAYQFLFSSHDVYLEHFRRYSRRFDG
jgi:2-polyprenyl-3-methyl-5-hydroxy-6-metoxy-1,4-benzoquinol methylase